MLECLFAALVFATMVPVLVSVWPYQKRAIEESIRRVAAQNIAKMVMDEVTQAGYLGVEAVRDRDLGDRTVTLVTQRDGYEESTDYVWQLEIRDASGLAGLRPSEKHVEVEVGWVDGAVPGQVRLSTIVNEGM